MMMDKIAKECLESEIIEFKRLYGASKVLQIIFQTHSTRYQQTNHHLSREIQEEVLKKLNDCGGMKQRLSQLLYEEQQRQLERPSPVEPCEPILHEEIKNLADARSITMNLTQLSNVFRCITYAFDGATYFDKCQPDSWESNLCVSTEFQRVIQTKGESLNPFLRPP